MIPDVAQKRRIFQSALKNWLAAICFWEYHLRQKCWQQWVKQWKKRKILRRARRISLQYRDEGLFATESATPLQYHHQHLYNMSPTRKHRHEQQRPTFNDHVVQQQSCRHSGLIRALFRWMALTLPRVYDVEQLTQVSTLFQYFTRIHRTFIMERMQINVNELAIHFQVNGVVDEYVKRTSFDVWKARYLRKKRRR